MSTTDYTSPVDKLLTMGEPKAVHSDWPNYLEQGFGPENIPELIKLATDQDLQKADIESSEVWGPVHAWRTLGQLHAQEAIEPLLPLFEQLTTDDWAMTELPEVYNLIGPAAVPTLVAKLQDTAQTVDIRIAMVETLETIVKGHPETRDEIVNHFIQQLQQFEQNDEELNGYLVAAFVALKATEALPVIEQAYQADRVDPLFPGDWDAVQVAFGLKTAAQVKQERRERGELPPPLSDSNPGSTRTKAQKAKVKAKRKMEKASRRKNRKHK